MSIPRGFSKWLHEQQRFQSCVHVKLLFLFFSFYHAVRDCDLSAEDALKEIARAAKPKSRVLWACMLNGCPGSLSSTAPVPGLEFTSPCILYVTLSLPQRCHCYSSWQVHVNIHWSIPFVVHKAAAEHPPARSLGITPIPTHISLLCFLDLDLEK